MYLLLAVIDILFDKIIAFLLVNWWAAISADNSGWLPSWLKWFQTFDASLDAGWRDGYKGYKKPTGPTSRWWQRTKWLYRNSAYGFSYWALGKPFNPIQWTVLKYEQTPERDLFYAKGPDGQFNYTYYGKWGTIKLGWKAWNYWRKTKWSDVPWGPEWRVPLVFSVNPFRRK